MSVYLPNAVLISITLQLVTPKIHFHAQEWEKKFAFRTKTKEKENCRSEIYNNLVIGALSGAISLK